jgi:hypothetical protein
VLDTDVSKDIIKNQDVNVVEFTEPEGLGCSNEDLDKLERSDSEPTV